MEAVVKLYSNTQNEIYRFLNTYFGALEKKMNKSYSSNTLEWQKKYQNPIEMIDMIGTFIENNDKFQINMWVSLDSGLFINITDTNADAVIRYIYERFPW